MRFDKKKLCLTLVVALAAVLLAGCGLSLAGDVTPPPNYVQPTTLPANPAGGQTGMGSDAGSGASTDSGAQPASVETTFPLVPPDPAQGAAIYTEKCAPCHGDRGMGDGVQGAQLPNPPAPIGSPDLAHKTRPADWYTIITNGNMKQFMPPFAQALSDRQRWDVLAYVYTLSATQDDLAKGKTVYNQSCAECHGASGLGDGAKAASLTSKPIAWAKDQSRLALLSTDDIVTVISEGKGEMPAFKDKLDAAQNYQVAAYIRSLSFSSGTPAEAAAGADATLQPGSTPQATAAANGTAPAVQTVTITGQVTNGTPGGSIPAGLKAKLSAYEGMTPSFDQTTDVAADGTYTFKDVKADTTFVYFVQVDANGVTYNSDILHGQDVTTGQANLPVKIYEPSSDASALKVDRLHVFFDFTKAGVVQVVNLYIISNPTDRVIIPTGDGKPVLSFELPQGATNLQFQDGQMGGRYVQTPTGFGDTMSVAPGMGQHQILFAYDMAYDNKLSVGVKPPLPVDAAIVMVPPGVNLKSGQLTDAGQQDVQGTAFHMYQAGSSLKAGEALNIALSGKPGEAAATNQSSMNYLLIGLGAFGLVLVGAGVWLYTHRAKAQPAAAAVGMGGAPVGTAHGEEESSEALLEAIVALDDLHAGGSLPEAAYKERRAALKARLGDALAREKGN